jgi:Putative prokaryotic signal transducing protein
VQVSHDDFRQHFELLSDEALLETSREDLVEAAKAVYDEELERRGLNTTVTEEPGEPMPDAVAPQEGADLALVATYNVLEEASLARGLLQSAEIPYVMQNDYSALGGIALRLLVPQQYEEQAIEILQHEISEEELAAQAEAAGMLEEDYAEYTESEEGEDELNERDQ